MGMKCDFRGCKKQKWMPHTHVYQAGPPVDKELIETYRVFCEIQGVPFSVPGGDGTEQNMYMSKRMKINAKQAKKYREELTKKHGLKKKK